MSKEVGKLKWLPGGTQNKTVFPVIFQLSPRREKQAEGRHSNPGPPAGGRLGGAG